MQFIRRNINKTLRNGDIIASSSSTSSSYYSSGGGSGVLSGNYLPATMNDENIYIVPHYVTFQETTTTTDTDGNETEVIKNLLEITTDGIIVNGNIIATGEVSAYGAGESSSSGSVTIYDGLDSTSTDTALSANQGRILKSMIDNIDVGEIDLSGYYSKTEIDTKLSGYSTTSHTHTFASLTSKPTTLAGYGITDAASSTHTHNYLPLSGGTISGTLIISRDAPAIKFINAAGDTVRGWLGFNDSNDATIWSSDSTTKYTILHSNNYSTYSPTLSAFNTHTANTTNHITATERTNWNTAYNNNHTHSNKSVLDGITATKVSNWDTVYTNWNNVFTIDSNGDLKIKVNVIGEKEISAYGEGTSTSSGGITIVDALTSTATDAALSANQGRVLKNLIDNIDLSEYVTDLSGYYTKTETDTLLSAKAASSHTHTIANITNLQTTLDGKSSTSHTHAFASLTSKPTTLSGYGITDAASSSHTHSYLPLSGGTITSSTANPLIINTTVGRLPYITFQNNGTTGGFVGGNSTGSMFIQAGSATDTEYSVLRVNTDGSAEISTNDTYYDVLTDKNASAKTVGNATKFSGYTMRTDATFVDKSVEAYIQYKVDATALSTSNFYPIVFSNSPKDLYVRMYSTPGSASASYNQNKLEFTMRGQGWNDTPAGLTVHNYNCYTASETTIGCIGMGQEAGQRVVWVRGGLTYYVIANQTPTLHSTDYTSGNQIYTVGTDFYGGTNTKVTIYWTPQTTSGLGTLYHSGSILANGNLATNGNLTVKGTSTFTGAITASSGATITGAITASSGATITGAVAATQVNTNLMKFNSGYGASLSSKGWYRFATSATANNTGGTYIFFIRRNYYNNNNESYIVSCTVDYGGVHWTQLNGHSASQLITNIRCTYTNNSTMYFDFYYNGTVANTIWVNAIGNCTLQTPTVTTSELTTSTSIALTDGYKSAVATAYAMTLYRKATSGGCYIRYGANSQLTYSWAAGVDNNHQFAWYYKDTSAGTDVCKMKLTSAGTLSSDYWVLNNVVTNPYLKLTHTYNSTTYTHYLQGYQGYLYLGAGSTKSLKIDSTGNCVAVGEVTAYSDRRLKDNIKPLTVRGELNPITYTKDGKESIGFIAQEVKEVYPELVTVDESTDEKYLSLNYAQLTAVLYAEIKELKERISKLENNK